MLDVEKGILLDGTGAAEADASSLIAEGRKSASRVVTESCRPFGKSINMFDTFSVLTQKATSPKGIVSVRH